MNKTKEKKRTSWQKWYEQKGRRYYRAYSRKRPQSYFRRWRKTNRKRLNKWYREYYSLPEVKRIKNAHNQAHSALRRGEIKKQVKCAICGNTAHLEMHHADYDKPYQVAWLCRKCHSKLHWKK